MIGESSRVLYRRLQPFKYKSTEQLKFFTGMRPAEDVVHPYFTFYTDGWLLVQPGYAWDGASGAIDTDNFMRGSLAHDVPYQAHQLGLALPRDWKDKADRMLVRLVREDGMSFTRSLCVYQAVKTFGRGRPRDLNKYDEILIAPK